MILPSLNPVLFDFGIVKIYYYGIIMALSVIIGLFVSKWFCEKFYSKKDFEIFFDLAIGTIIFGFIGARIYYCVLAHKYFSNNLFEIFAIQNGGMSIHGAIIGGLLYALIYLKIKKLNILKYLDILSVGLVSGQILGRWGNYFNTEAFGLPTNLPVKLFVPIAKRPLQFLDYQYFHPTFLYESILNLFVLFLLIFIAKKTTKSGYVFFSYLLLYSIIRFFIEKIRIDSVLNINSVPFAQIVCIIGIIAGILGIFAVKYNEEKGN